MANTSGGSGSRLIMTMSSSLDQSHQPQHQASHQQQQQQQQQQQPSSRRSSAVNFDQATSQLVNQYNQQQISQVGQKQQHVIYNSSHHLVNSHEPTTNAIQQQQQQIRRNSATLVCSDQQQQKDYVNYYYQQDPGKLVGGGQASQMLNCASNNSNTGGASSEQQSSTAIGGGGGVLSQSQTQSQTKSQLQSQLQLQQSRQKNGPHNNQSVSRYNSSGCIPTAVAAASSNSSAGGSGCQQPSTPAAAAVAMVATQQQQQPPPPTATAEGAATSKASYIKDDIDIMFNRLMALEAFRKLHPTVIRNLCSYAFIERIDKGVIVFRQGDDAINWYALLEGSVDVKVSQSGGQKDGVTLCTLGVGTTFGASVMPGKSHSVSVVTSDDCTLLRVRRADFQEIFNEQSHLINNVESSPFCSFTSLNRISTASQSRVSKRATSTASQQQQQTSQKATSLAGIGQQQHQHRSQQLAQLQQHQHNNLQQQQQHQRQYPTYQVSEPAQLANANGILRQASMSSGGSSSRGGYQAASSRRSAAGANSPAAQDNNNVRRQQQQQQQGDTEEHVDDVVGDDDEDANQDQEQVDEAGELGGGSGNEELNLDSIDSNELSSHLMRIGWVLRTLMLDQCPNMIQNRRIHPHQMHKHHYHHQQQQARHLAHQQQLGGGRLHKQLMSANSSSQLLTTTSQQSNNNNSSTGSSSGGSSSLTKSAASAAGRKVANYVASSFMRTNSKQSSSGSTGGHQQAAKSSSTTTSATSPSHPLFTSNSFDANLAQYQHLHSGGSSSGHHYQQSASTVSSKVSSSQTLSGHQFTMSEPVLFRRSMLGREMVDWLLNLSQANTNAARFVSSRLQAVSMWQVLLEQGIVFAFNESDLANSQSNLNNQAQAQSSGGHANNSKQQTNNCCQFQFCDDQQAYYKFWFDREGAKQQQQQQDTTTLQRPNETELALANDSLWWSLKVLSKLAPDACFRLILSKRPHERSFEEVDIVFEELQHLKALSHLTNSVKKELAACVTSEHHAKQNTVIFNQGDVGQSWYIILRGSVNVVIVGKGVVCTLHDGDDFGKLALVNDAPRAATIVTNEPNCYFLRVDKHNFNTILRDVEANTVRLKEHGKEVLILQKVPVKEQPLTGASVSAAPAGSQVGDGVGQQQPASGGQQAAQAHGEQMVGLAAAAAAASSTQVHSGGAPGGGGGQQQQQQQLTANSSVSVSSSSSLAAAAAGVAIGSSAAIGANSGATPSAVVSSALKYMVMAGTAEKMLEHLLETRIDGHTQIGPLLTGKSGLIQHDQVSSYIQCHGDNFLEDFILTHRIFMPTTNLCNELLKQYQCQTKSQLSNATGTNNNSSQQQQQSNSQVSAAALAAGEHTSLDEEYLIAKKRRVVKFVRCWMLITREHFFQQQQIQSFLTTIHPKVKQDANKFISLQPELKAIARILELHLEEDLESRHKGVQRWIDDIYGNILPIRRHSGAWELTSGGQQQSLSGEQFLASLHQRRFEHKLSNIQAEDEVVFRVYCTDHSFATLKARFDEKAGEIKQLAARKLNLQDKELILVHVKSNGERIIYNDLESNISTSLSVNGRIFVCPLDHIDAISPLPEQDPFQEVYQSLATTTNQPAAICSADNNNIATAPNNNSTAANNGSNDNCAPGLGQQQTSSSSSLSLATNSYLADQQQQMSTTTSTQISSHLLVSTPTNYADIKTQMSLSVNKLEEFSSRDIAYCLTQLAWSLLRNMHEFELIYTVFGRHNFKQITANLNVFLRHFNEIQYWVVTQICLSTSLSKRVQILRKFIKIAAHCKELQNLNAFFAIIMGLSNMAVARLTQTWERLPSKLKRTFSQFESLIDPSRNHRRYRIFISKMEPPIIPFMPLFLKDMTFAHEGNKTYLENGLINFEKMQMVAQTLRTIRYCKSRPMKLDSSACKFKGSIRSIELFFRDLKIIDNQRTLTQMSHQLEHRKT